MNRQMLIKLRGDKSRRDIAEKLDITPQMLGAIERGTRNPSRNLAKKMGELYRVSANEIFFVE